MQVFEDAKRLPSDMGDTRTMLLELLELVEFGQDVAPELWKENLEGWVPSHQRGYGREAIVARANQALARRERLGRACQFCGIRGPLSEVSYWPAAAYTKPERTYDGNVTGFAHLSCWSKDVDERTDEEAQR